MEMTLLERLAVVTLGVRETEKALLQEVTAEKLVYISHTACCTLTPSHSRKQRQCSGNRASRTHQQCRLRPSGRRATVPCRA
jgi:hypothetical protein